MRPHQYNENCGVHKGSDICNPTNQKTELPELFTNLIPTPYFYNNNNFPISYNLKQQLYSLANCGLQLQL